MIQNLINHIGLIVDKSGSMSGQPVVRVFDAELKALKQRSKAVKVQWSKRRLRQGL